jgi:hypothetical protein
MPVVRGGDDNGLNIFSFKKLPKIRRTAGGIQARFSKPCLQMKAVHITDSDNLGIRLIEKSSQILQTHPADTDKTERNSIRGSRFTEDGTPHNRRKSEHRPDGPFQKRPTIHRF